MKFGGSSVQDAAHIKKVAEIVLSENRKNNVAVVLSAMKGVTDLLIEAAHLAEQGNSQYHKCVTEIQNKESITIKNLFETTEQSKALTEELTVLFQDLENILHGVELIKECSPRSLDFIMSFGERLNCLVFSAYLNKDTIAAQYIDARQYLITNDLYGKALVKLKKSYTLIQEALKNTTKIPIITGFIASTEEGITTTLGRNGSDYSASLFGAALDVDSVEIWTDVDGVYSADPRKVSSSFVIPEISIEEAMELSYFGAKVIHPYTLLPTVEKEIPIIIKNTMNPEAPGTMIWNKAQRNTNAITGIASVEDVSLLNIVGGGMVGVPGVASKVFTALAEADVNVIMISQASSEHSICVVCKSSEAETAKKSLTKALSNYIDDHRILRIDLIEQLEIIAVIGENMNGRPGISGKLFSSLGEAGINVLAIAQGSSERNISFVIHKEDCDKALNTVHQAFLSV